MHTVARYGELKATKDPIVGRVFDAVSDKGRYSFPDMTKTTSQMEVHVNSPWPHIGIHLVASNCALVDLDVFTNTGKQRKEVGDHPFRQLLRKPNDHMSHYEFVYAMVATRILAGNAYIYLSSDKGGAPDEMLLLRPDCVKIVPGSSGRRINGYVYDVSGGGDAIPLKPEQVIHWKAWHPTDPYYGLSLIQVMALSVQAEKGMSTWQARFFSKENAVPAGIVTVPPTISNQDYEDLKDNWYRHYGGTQRATAIIRANDVKYQSVGTSHVEMDFLQGRLFEKELILNTIGVPLSIFAVNANEANARAGQELLTSMTIWPIMVEIGQKWTAELLPFWGDNLVCEPDDIRIKDETAELKQLQAYGPYDTINEVRAVRGKDPLPGGDIPAAGPLAGMGTPAFGKPNIDQTQGQIESGKGWLKEFASDEQRRAFFGNLADGTVGSHANLIGEALGRHEAVDVMDQLGNAHTLHGGGKNSNGTTSYIQENHMPKGTHWGKTKINVPRDQWEQHFGSLRIVGSKERASFDAQKQQADSATWAASDAMMGRASKGIETDEQRKWFFAHLNETGGGDSPLTQRVKQLAGPKNVAEWSKHHTRLEEIDKQLKTLNPDASWEFVSGHPGEAHAKARALHAEREQVSHRYLELSDKHILPALSQAQSEGHSAFKGLETDEQRKWFFANNPQYSPESEGRHNARSIADQSHVHGRMGKEHALEHFPVGTKIRMEAKIGDHDHSADFEVTGHKRHQQGGVVPQLKQTSGFPLRSDKYGRAKPVDFADIGRQVEMHEKAFMSQPRVHITKPSGSSKDAMDTIDVLPVPVLTSAAKRELQQFGTFATKRLDRKAAQDVDGFMFNHTPTAYQILAHAYYDATQDGDEFGRMIDVLAGQARKGITPAASRVSVSGKVDPLAKEKVQYAQTIRRTTGDYLSSLCARIADHAEHQPTSGFWNGEQQTYKDDVGPKAKDGLLAFLTSLAALVAMQNGVTLDEAGLKTDVEGLYSHWAAAIPAAIVRTTKNLVDAIYQRWRDTDGATADDLKTALDQAYAFSPDRAEMIGETEATSAGAQVTRITAQDVAKALDVPFEDDDIAGPPAHGECRCFSTTQVKTDEDGNATGVTRVWHTVKDVKVCNVCEPLDGKTFAEIGDVGMAA